MPRYTPFHPDHEYLGQVLIDFENAAGAGKRIQHYFQKHGLDDVSPSEWYPAQMFLDVLSDMTEHDDAQMMDLVSIGLKQVETAVMPPEFARLPLLDILGSMDVAYRLNNRGTDIGEIQCEVVDDHYVKMIFRVPQPDDIWYGVTYGYMRRFAPRDTYFTVEYDEAERRDFGSETTVIHINWESD